jgi:hypothetical protein
MPPKAPGLRRNVPVWAKAIHPKLLAKFTIFLYLPAEIRIMIWKLLAEEERLVIVEWFFKLDHTAVRARDWAEKIFWKDSENDAAFENALSLKTQQPVLHVCQESSGIALKAYTVKLEFNTTPYKPDLYLSPSDTLYLIDNAPGTKDILSCLKDILNKKHTKRIPH